MSSDDSDDGSQTPIGRFSWPDLVSHGTASTSTGGGQANSQPIIAGDAEMDFSLSHFVQSAIPPADTAATYQWPIPPSASAAASHMPYPEPSPQQWQQPFNYAAMFDIAYMQYRVGLQ